MDLIASTPIPRGGQVQAAPIPGGNAVGGEHPEIDAYRALAPEYSKGLRASVNSIGAAAHALAGSVAETMGLTDFANSRFAEAKDYTDFADAVGPRVRDVRAVRDLTDAADFASGLAGTVVGGMAPLAAGGAAGAAVKGLRGAAVGAVAGMYPQMAGEQALRVKDAPGTTPGQRLENALGVGAVNTALGVAVPGMLAKRALRGAAPSVARSVAEGAAGQAAAGAAMSKASQAGHTALDPNRDTSGDTGETVNAAVAGAGMGAAFGGATGLASKIPAASNAARQKLTSLRDEYAKGREETKPLDLPADRPATQDELKAAVGHEEPPADPSDISGGIGKKGEELSSWSDAFDEHVTKNLSAWWEKVKEHPWAKKFEGLVDDPEKQQAFADELKKHWNETKEKPAVKRMAEQFGEYRKKATELGENIGKKISGEKPNLQRTQVDFDLMDAAQEHMDPAKWENLSPAERVKHADDLKAYVLHQFGQRDPVEGPGKAAYELGTAARREQDRPTRPVEVPHALQDLYGEKLAPLLDKAHSILKGGGEAMQNVAKVAKSVAEASKSRRARESALDDMVRGNLDPRFLGANKIERDQNVKMVSDFLRKSISEDVDVPKFRQAVKTLFGDAAEHVLEQFDKERSNVTRGYETLVEPDSPAEDARKLAEAAMRAEGGDTGAAENSPYRDHRMHKFYDEQTQLPHVMEDLKAQYGEKDVRFKSYPEVSVDEEGKAHLTGRSAVYAEDASVPEGFSREEIGRIREQQGKAGHENSVVTVVRKGEGGRNETVAVSIPRLMSEVMRTMKYEGEGGGRNYARAVAHEGIARLAGDPELIGIKNGLDFPDDMRVMKVEGKWLTWKDVKPRSISAKELQLQHMTTDMVDAAQRADTRDQIKEVLKPQMERNLAKLAAEGNEKAAERMKGAIERVNEEIDRRERDGDRPLHERQGITDTDKDVRQPMQRAEDRKPRKPTYEDSRPLREAPKPVEEDNTAPINREAAKDRAFAKVKENLKTAGMPEPKDEAQGKLSEVRPGKEPMSPEMQAKVVELVKRHLGDDVGGKFVQKLMTADGKEASGMFKVVDGAERIIMSLRAVDPLGVGHHEVMHALFARLMASDPRVANTLSAAAGSPKIMGQLRKLLAAEPKALKQLADHEERVAYMYQFWKAGALEMGPKATTVFEKVRAFFGRMLSAWTELSAGEDALPKAERVMEAFHNGRLADRSAAGRVLAELVPKEPAQKAWSKSLGDWAGRVLFTADGYVRSFDVPAITAAADKFFSPPEQQGAPSGMMQTRHVAKNTFLNRYMDAVKGQDADAVLAKLRAGNDESNPAVVAMRSLFKDVRQYMVDHGVKAVDWDDAAKAYVEHDLGDVKNFVPRVYDREAIAKNYAAFEKLLADHGYGKRAIENIMGSSKAAVDSDASAGLTYYAPETMARKINIPDALLAPYLRKDMNGIMFTYLGHAVRRAEYASRFGNQGQGIEAAKAQALKEGATPEQMKSFGQYVQAMEGTLGHDIDPALRKFFNGVTTYQNLRLLPLALFSSLIDPLGIAVRGGTLKEAGSAFVRGIRELVSDVQDDKRAFARTIGSMTEAMDDHMISDAYGQGYATGMSKWLNDKLFQMNGMESWNNSMRIAASSAAHDFIVRHVERPTEHSARYLAELGLEPGDVHIKGGKLDLTPQVVDALNKWVDGAVLRPHAGVRPIWMSDPHFMLIAHLKQFTYSFQKTIVARVVHEAKNGNVAPLAVMSSYVPGIIAADIIRATVTPGLADNDRQASWDAMDWFVHGVNRAGLTGPGQYALDAGADLGRNSPLPGVASVIGPAGQQLIDLAKAGLGKQSGAVPHQLLRALPLVPPMNFR